MQQGDSVEWFSAAFQGAAKEEVLDGVRIVREGRQWTVHWRAFRHYRSRLKSSFDVVVDEINTIPFFTSLWSGIPTIVFIHQLAREVWWYESRFPISAIGFVCEPWYLRLYRAVPIVTVSNSTQNDLKQLGLKGPITVIPEGLETITEQRADRPQTPRFLYVGRLAPSKRISDLLRALAAFNQRGVPGQLRLIGDGAPKYLNELRSLASDLGVLGNVEFLGRTSVVQKHQEMASAHMLLLASVREGWGLVVTEANAYGTPAVAYDVPGLRDSIRREETGLLVPPTPQHLAAAMCRLWQDRTLFSRLSDGAIKWSATFTFDETARRFRDAVSSVLASSGRRAASRGRRLGAVGLYGRLGSLRRGLKRRAMLTPFDPFVSSLARGIDYLSPRLSPPLAIETSVAIGNRLRLMMPPGLPSARRLLAGDYEPEVSALIRSLLQSGMTFVDAGANVGYYTLLAAELVGKTGHVYAFEPDQDTYGYLEMNISANRITQASIHRKALAEAPGTRAFTPSAWEGGYVSTTPTSSQSVQVETESLDHFFSGHGWPPVHLIKLDVEGAEASALAGMTEVVERNPLQLVMEFNLAAIRRAGGTPDDLSRTLRGLGFQYALIVEQGRQVSLNYGLPSSGLVYNLLLTK